MDEAVRKLREVIWWPWDYRSNVLAPGMTWPRGVLIHGPAGCGKSAAVEAALLRAHQCGSGISKTIDYRAGDDGCRNDAVSVKLVAATLFSSVAGESEKALRDAFASAHRLSVEEKSPAVIILDNAETMFPKRSAKRQHEGRVVTQLLTLLDGAENDPSSAQDASHVAVVAITRYPNLLDPALRRPGRFDIEIAISLPNFNDRMLIARKHIQQTRMPVEDAKIGNFCEFVAQKTMGFTGADVKALLSEASRKALREYQTINTGEIRLVSERHISEARITVRPAELRHLSSAFDVSKDEGFSSIVGLDSIIPLLRRCAIWPFQPEKANAMMRMGISPSKGLLLYGPPGGAKTSIAKAISREMNVPLIALSGADLFSMYVGEGEEILRQAFSSARRAAPCVLFFDEIDSLASKRDIETKSGSSLSPSDRVLATLLTEMDGLVNSQARPKATTPRENISKNTAEDSLSHNVLVVAATNRPWMVDEALLRPGRFDERIYISPLSPPDISKLLRYFTRSMPVADDFDPHDLEARLGPARVGAEIKMICQEAALHALHESKSQGTDIAERFGEISLSEPHMEPKGLLETPVDNDNAATFQTQALHPRAGVPSVPECKFCIHQRHFHHVISSLNLQVDAELLSRFEEFTYRYGTNPLDLNSFRSGSLNLLSG